MPLTKPVGIGRPSASNTLQTLSRITEVVNALQGVDGLERRAVRFEDLLAAGVLTRNQDGFYYVTQPDYSHTRVVVVTSVAGVLKLDLAKGLMFICELTEDIASIKFENVPAPGYGTAFSVLFIQHPSLPKLVAGWPAALKWVGAPYVMSTGVGMIDEVGVSYYSSAYIIGKYGQDAA